MNALTARDRLLTKSISAQGNLSHDCWMAMTCLTKITEPINETSCRDFFYYSDLLASMQHCESVTQFPTVPVLFGHVTFLYRTNNTHLNIELARVPDYVCYDEQLCDFLTPTFRNGNDSCRHSHEMSLEPHVEYRSWADIIDSIKPRFRGCLTIPKMKNDLEHSSLYCCSNSSRCISKHRVVDGISDCHMNDDEEQFELSCSMNDTHRFKCFNENKCRSHLFSRDVCSSASQQSSLNDILFQEICDRFVHLLPETIDGRNHTDETECEHWECSNIYTRCDLFPNCPNGKDEENCTQSICPPHSLACMNSYNYTFTCLPADRVGNGIIDCLGASDEPHHCREIKSTGFRCLNDTTCISVALDLCDGIINCPVGDDESFCGDRRRICDNSQHAHQSDEENAFCLSFSAVKVYFSLKSSSIYPPSRNRTLGRIAEWAAERDIVENNMIDEPDDPAWAWRCNRGLYARVWLGKNNFGYKCFCPPSYYGDLCQYQSQRVSLTMRLTAVDQGTIHAIVVTLIDDDDDRQEVNSYHQLVFVANQGCRTSFNIYLLFSQRSKNSSKIFSVRVDAFDKTSLTYLASWHFPIPFLFLPVNRLAAKLTVPFDRAVNTENCSLSCHNGDCIKYSNAEKFFCRCMAGWSGAQCHIRVNCADCSSDSVCVGSKNNRSICVCPLTKFGPRCLLTQSCPLNFCKNNGRCVKVDEGRTDNSYLCICPEQFYGWRCLRRKNTLEVSWDKMGISSYLLVYLITLHDYKQQTQIAMLEKLKIVQHAVTLYIATEFQIVFVKTDDSYYLAFLQKLIQYNISTSINPSRRCASINEILNSTVLAMSRIRRVKYYHVPCRNQLDLLCFFDESLMCLCTLEHHANCFAFDHNPDFACRRNDYCENGAKCLQHDPACPSTTICICTDCFFGNRCQFYAKGIGLTLDDILRYEIQSNVTFSGQSLSVKVSAAMTILMLVSGLINSVVSFITFYSEDSRRVGCGMYLLASSITSLLTMTIFTLKFWFLILTQISVSISRPVHRGGCVSIESILKLLLYTDNWLNACVAIERAINVAKGVNFDKAKSKRVARWTILLLPISIMATLIHEPLFRDLFDDSEEQRVWCVTYYSRSVQNYNTAILFFHFLVPFASNLFSSLFIIFTAARQRGVVRRGQAYKQNLREQFHEHKQLVISPVAVVLLSLPRLIISLSTGCVRSSRNPWWYLSGYFISFIPSVLVFAVFVLPSQLYRKQFNEAMTRWRRRLHSQ